MTPITLPGTISGLICPGACVRYADCDYTVIHNGGLPRRTLAHETGVFAVDESLLALNLGYAVSRIHAAWWVIERGPVTDDEHVLLFTVKNGGHVNRKGQEQLRDMVLRRTPALQDPA